ncbi:GDSL-type esterase/lipase family protein [Kamptonema animale CS-326]|uniref:GDSL-type esterase/lipase family protein n=1 Tax=Kamptonema animale TaxID=92934 RepID=UPI00232A7C36|nr:GDSL-type esterase/lipase family protein [Kamptonema animale]MDB9513140.1 GDSL-type esterase/lipase family protein [Kamptonema animale CS-326]
MKVSLIILAIAAALLVVVEVSLRVFFGFGNPLIYIADSDCGYLLAPNQSVRRFGNRIEINQHSMRSPPITPIPAVSTRRVLLLGDSIANGGWWTDRSDTISEMMARLLAQGKGDGGDEGDGGDGEVKSFSSLSSLPSSFSLSSIPQSKVEVLNASANSWGPRNELAYLEKFGHFGAIAVVLLINTDDLFAKAPSSWVVGRDRNYPNRKPPSAIVEVLTRYLLPYPPLPELDVPKKERGDIVGYNIEAIRQIKTIVTSVNAQFILAMTPLVREISDRHPRDYEIKARTRLTEFTQTEQILYLDFLPIFKSVQHPTSLYRDNIHLSIQGNQLVSQIITNSLRQQFGNW